MASPTPPPEPPRRPEQFPPSGPNSLPHFVVRAAARLFDLFLIMMMTSIGLLAFADIESLTEPIALDDVPFGWQVGASLLPFVYDALSVAVSGRTLGKALFGITTVRYVDGGRTTVSQALLRASAVWIGWIVAIGFPVGDLALLWLAIVYASPFANPILRGLHDKAAGTIVVRS